MTHRCEVPDTSFEWSKPRSARIAKGAPWRCDSCGQQWFYKRSDLQTPLTSFGNLAVYILTLGLRGSDGRWKKKVTGLDITAEWVTMLLLLLGLSWLTAVT